MASFDNTVKGKTADLGELTVMVHDYQRCVADKLGEPSPHAFISLTSGYDHRCFLQGHGRHAAGSSEMRCLKASASASLNRMAMTADVSTAVMLEGHPHRKVIFSK